MPSTFRESSTPAPQSQGWQDGATVDGQPAKTKQQGSRFEAIHGGNNGNQPRDGHGHIVANDGVNADYIRLPGGMVILDESRDDPYEEYYDPNH